MAEGNGESGYVIEKRSGGGLGVFILGVAVGAGLALLFAPRAGDDTRAALARGARKARRKARRYLDAARESAADTREALEQRLARHHEADDRFDGEDDGV